jgi:host factor-I protein
MKQPIDIQNAFLSQAQIDKVPMTLFLVNGFQIRGTLKGFDNFTIEVDTEGKQQVIYKHAISTIVPLRPFKLQTQ